MRADSGKQLSCWLAAISSLNAAKSGRGKGADGSVAFPVQAGASTALGPLDAFSQRAERHASRHTRGAADPRRTVCEESGFSHGLWCGRRRAVLATAARRGGVGGGGSKPIDARACGQRGNSIPDDAKSSTKACVLSIRIGAKVESARNHRSRVSVHLRKPFVVLRLFQEKPGRLDSAGGLGFGGWLGRRMRTWVVGSKRELWVGGERTTSS